MLVEPREDLLCREMVSVTLLGVMQNVTTTIQENLATSSQTDPQIPILDLYPKSTLAEISNGIYTKLFIVRLFVIANYLKQLECPSVADWYNKLWCVHVMESYVTVKGMRDISIYCYGIIFMVYC